MDNTAVRIEPDATERELRESVDFADVESCVDDGGAAYVIHGMLPAEHAITASPTLHEPDMARVDAALAQLRAELVDQRTMIRDLAYWSV